jgi:hypothetical protein
MIIACSITCTARSAVAVLPLDDLRLSLFCFGVRNPYYYIYARYQIDRLSGR